MREFQDQTIRQLMPIINNGLQQLRRTRDVSLTSEAVAAAKSFLGNAQGNSLEAGELCEVLNQIGILFLERFTWSKERGDIDQAVALFERASAISAGKPTAGVPLLNLGNALIYRSSQPSCESDLDCAIDSLKQSAELAQNPRSRSIRLNSLAEAMRLSFERTGSRTTLFQAIETWNKALEMCGEEPRLCGAILQNLGMALLELFQLEQRPEVIDNAITMLESACKLDVFEAKETLAKALVTRGEHKSDIADFDTSLLIWSGLVDDLKTSKRLGGAWEVLYRLGLAVTYSKRYALSSDMKDLYDARQNLETCLELIQPSAVIDSIGVLLELGVVEKRIYESTGSSEMLDSAINHYMRALALSPPRESVAALSNNLSESLRLRFLAIGQKSDLDRAVESARQSVEATLQTSNRRRDRSANLRTALKIRYDSYGSVADRDEFLQLCNDCAELGGALPGEQAELALALMEKYEYSRDLADIEQAMALLATSIEQTDKKSPYWAKRKDVFCGLLTRRFRHTGRVSDLERAIEGYLELLENCTQPDHGYLMNAASAFYLRFECTRARGDLERALEFEEQCYESLPPQSPSFLDCVSNLIALRLRLIDLDKNTTLIFDSEELIRATLLKVPNESPIWFRMTSHLSALLISKFEYLERRSDVDEAISLLRRMNCISDVYAQLKPSIAYNLAYALFRRFKSGDRQARSDLDESIAILSSIDVIESKVSELRVLQLLGEALLERHLLSSSPDSLKMTLNTLEGAYQLSESLRATMPVSHRTIHSIGQLSTCQNLISAYMSSLPSLVGAEKENCERRVFEIAEASKSRVLNDLVGLGDLVAPIEVPQLLKDQEQQVVDQLILGEIHDLDPIMAPANQQERTKLAETRLARMTALNEIWSAMESHSESAREYVEIRRGAPADYSDLKKLLEVAGPACGYVSIFAKEDQTFLFFCRSHPNDANVEIKVITTDVTRTEIIEHLNNYCFDIIDRGLRQSKYKEQSWRALGKKLFGKLTTLLPGIDHLIVCAHGLYHVLPLHALTIDDLRTTLLDSVSVSYTPSLGSLLRTVVRPPSASKSTGEAVVIGFTTALPSTLRERLEREYFLDEALSVAALLDTTPIIDSNATKVELVDRLLKRPSTVHLSCHGRFNWDDPLSSGFQLADGTFQAREFLPYRSCSDLITLSCCELGLVKVTQGDEVSGFVQALISSGARSALLGLWSVSAHTTAAWMREFYELLKNPKLSKAQAARSASMALRDGRLTDSDAALDTGDPYFWAPFAIYGDWRNQRQDASGIPESESMCLTQEK